MRATRYSMVIEKNPIYQRYEMLTILEGLLDKIYFEDLRISIDKIPDHKKVEIIIGTEIDLRNIDLMVDLRARDVNPEVVLSTSFKPFRLREEDLNQVARAKLNTISDIIVKTPYQRFASRVKSIIEEGKVKQMEQVIYSEIYSKARSVIRETPNSFAYVIGHLQIAEMEARNLFSLSTGKELGLEEGKIKSLLYL